MTTSIGSTLGFWPDMPCRRNLNQYSRDDQRAFAEERDRIERLYSEAQVRLDVAVSKIDREGPLSQEDFDEASSALNQFVSVAEQARSIELGSTADRGELLAFSSQVQSTVKHVESALSKGHALGKRAQDRAQRAVKIRSNAESGLPWNHGLDPEQLTEDDVAALGGLDAVFPGLEPTARAMKAVRVAENTEYFQGELPAMSVVADVTEAMGSMGEAQAITLAAKQLSGALA